MAAGLFRAAINEILSNLPRVVPYQDDILIDVKTKQEHDLGLENRLIQINDKNVKINCQKSMFQQTSIQY